MLQRLHEICAELSNADDVRLQQLWDELTHRVLASACKEAVKLGSASLPGLLACYEQLGHPRLVSWVNIASRRSDIWITPMHLVTPDLKAAVSALLAVKCAEGESSFAELVTWVSRLTDREIQGDLTAFVPIVPVSPFAWVRGALTLLKAGPTIGPEVDVFRHLANHEMPYVLADVNCPDEVKHLERLLVAHAPSTGLNYVELWRWSGNALVSLTPVDPFGTTQNSNPWPELLRLSASTNAIVRFVALLLIEGLVAAGQADRPPEILPLMVAGLDEEHPVRRALCLRAASRLSIDAPRSLLRLLPHLMRDPVAAVRAESALAVLRLARVTRRIRAGLMAQLTDNSPAVRRDAANAIAGLGTQVANSAMLRTLAAQLALETNDATALQLARAARSHAARMTPGIRRGLTRLLAIGSELVRIESLQALSDGGVRAAHPAVRRAICKRFADPSATVRREAIWTYTQLCRDDSPPTEALVSLLADEDGGVQLAAVELVAYLKRRVVCASIISRLARLLWSQEVNPTQIKDNQSPGETTAIQCLSISVTRMALVALTGVGPAAVTTPVIDGVLANLLSRNRILAEQACHTIEAIGVVGDIAIRLGELLRSEDYRQRSQVVGALAQVGELACWPALLDELRELLDSDITQHRIAALCALEWLGPKGATPFILNRLQELRNDPDANVRFHLADALGRLEG